MQIGKRKQKVIYATNVRLIDAGKVILHPYIVLHIWGPKNGQNHTQLLRFDRQFYEQCVSFGEKLQIGSIIDDFLTLMGRDGRQSRIIPKVDSELLQSRNV